MTMALDHDQLRSHAAEGWTALRNSGTNDGRVFLSTTGKFEAVHVSANAGSVVGNDQRSPLAARRRYSLGEDYRLHVVPGPSPRVAPADVQMHPLALSQLRDVSARIVGSDSRALRADHGVLRADDLQMARALIGKVGTDAVDELWRVGSYCDGFLRTVSYASALGGDAFTQLFINSELTVMLPELVEVEKRMPSARDVFSMKFLNAPGAKDYEFRKIDRKGRAVHTVDFRGDAPTATITSDPIRRPLRWMWSGQVYSWQDIEEWKQARANGSGLPDIIQLQNQTSRESILELESIDLFFGCKGLGILGLLSTNDAGTASTQGIALPTAVSNYSALSSELAVAQLLVGVKALFAKRFQRDIVVLLGTRDYSYCATTTYVDANTGSTGESLLQIALKRGKDLGLVAFVHVPEVAFESDVETYLLGLGYNATEAAKYAGGINSKAVQVTMVRDPAYSRGICGQDLMQFPPDQTAVSTSIKMALSTGGYEVKQPDSIHLQQVNDPA